MLFSHRPSRTAWRIAILLVLCVAPIVVPQVTFARSSGKSPLGRVRFIYHGLAVQPPRHRAAKAKVKQSLYSSYQLHTHHAQKASVNFRDGTVLHINQNTDCLLRSPHVTAVKRGEVDEMVTPGTNHQIQTAAAIASAIGTEFDVRYFNSTMTVTVVEGAVLVENSSGSAVVKSGQQTTVHVGQAPSPPRPADAAAVTAWLAPLPAPSAPIGENIALDANGGQAYAATSERGGSWSIGNVNDGHADQGWQSADGAVSNQSFKLRFAGSGAHAITGVILNCAAIGGQSPDNDLKDFQLRVSSTNDAEASFQTVFSGTCKQSNAYQTFALPDPVNARYVELFLANNYGGRQGIAVAEVGIISPVQPPAGGHRKPTPTATLTPTPVSTTTPSSTTGGAASSATLTGSLHYLETYGGSWVGTSNWQVNISQTLTAAQLASGHVDLGMQAAQGAINFTFTCAACPPIPPVSNQGALPAHLALTLGASSSLHFDSAVPSIGTWSLDFPAGPLSGPGSPCTAGPCALQPGATYTLHGSGVSGPCWIPWILTTAGGGIPPDLPVSCAQTASVDLTLQAHS